MVERLPSVPDHESHLLSRNIFCSDNEVSFVFPVRRVEDDYEVAIS